MIIGISGQYSDSVGNKKIAGAGKDVVANKIMDYGFISLAWADPMKRFVKDVYNFDDDALWGGSELRVLPDQRYPMPNGGFLTPRLALQRLGTEYGRHCYANTWVDYGIRVAQKILDGAYYTPKKGLYWETKLSNFKGVVFSDVRFINEVIAIQKAGGFVVRVKRQHNEPFDTKAMDLLHTSETELVNENDSLFDYILDNNSTLDNLYVLIDKMMGYFNTIPHTTTQ